MLTILKNTNTPENRKDLQAAQFPTSRIRAEKVVIPMTSTVLALIPVVGSLEQNIIKDFHQGGL